MNTREWFTVGLLIAGAVVGTVAGFDPAWTAAFLVMAIVVVRTA